MVELRFIYKFHPAFMTYTSKKYQIPKKLKVRCVLKKTLRRNRCVVGAVHSDSGYSINKPYVRDSCHLLFDLCAVICCN